MLSEEKSYINPNRKDPRVFLQKARYFYDSAKFNKDDDDGANYTDDDSNYIPDDNDYEIVGANVELIKNKLPVQRIIIDNGRYYDPIKKHYYKIPDAIPAKKVADVWFPQNPLSYRTVYDASTGQYYKVDKVYDADGNYSIQYTKLDYRPYKRPGTNFYKPNYT